MVEDKIAPIKKVSQLLMIDAPPGTRNEAQFQKGIVEDARYDDEKQQEARAREGKNSMGENVPFINLSEIWHTPTKEKVVPAEKQSA